MLLLFEGAARHAVFSDETKMMFWGRTYRYK
jgi:hypothetical protein